MTDLTDLTDRQANGQMANGQSLMGQMANPIVDCPKAKGPKGQRPNAGRAAEFSPRGGGWGATRHECLHTKVSRTIFFIEKN